jgi:type II restriction enzyme
MSLDQKLAETVVTSINSDRIIIVCKDAEKNIIESVMQQIGWGSRIQTIITFNKIVDWYEKVMRGEHSNNIGRLVLSAIKEELELEFPMLGLSSEFEAFCFERGYLDINKSNYPEWFT